MRYDAAPSAATGTLLGQSQNDIACYQMTSSDAKSLLQNGFALAYP